MSKYKTATVTDWFKVAQEIGIENERVQAELARVKAQNVALRKVLSRIENYPVHSEPTGAAMDMKDLAHYALAPEPATPGKATINDEFGEKRDIHIAPDAPEPHRRSFTAQLRQVASRPNLHGTRRRILLAVGKTVTKAKP